MSVRIDGTVRILHPGEALHVPANKSHSMWNHSDNPAIVNWRVQPALTTEYLLETLAGLATEGKTNSIGTPKFLQVVLIAFKYANVFRLSRPPYLLQKIVFTILTPLAYASGYRPLYKRYID